MTKKLFLLTFLISIFTFHNIFAQRITRFRPRQPYMEELQRLFETSTDKEKAEKFIAEFGVAYNGNVFT